MKKKYNRSKFIRECLQKGMTPTEIHEKHKDIPTSMVYTVRWQMNKKTKQAAAGIDVVKAFEILDQEEANAVYQANNVREFVASDKADDVQVGGDHYKELGVQPWKAMHSWMTVEEFKGFLRGNAIKYLARTNKKGGVEDIKKARHYIDKLLEVIEENKEEN